MASFRRAIFLWSVFLAQAFWLSCGRAGPVNSNANALGYMNTVTDLDRMEAKKAPNLLIEVARTIRNMSRYFLREANVILNAIDDVLFCIRLAQGQLAQLRAEAPQGYGGPAVEALLDEAEADLNQTVAILEGNFIYSPNFLKDFSFTRTHARLASIQRLDANFTIPDFQEIWNSAFQINLQRQNCFVTDFSPEASDHCMSQIQPQEDFSCTGGGETCRPYYCPVDAPCWLMTTRPGAKAYYLTHQLLLLLLGENGECAPDFEEQAASYFGGLLPPGTDAGAVTAEIMRHQCRRVLNETLVIAEGGYPDIVKDLFLEQGFLCGAAVNLPGFFDPNFVREAASWQLPSGCYGFVHPSGPGIDYPGVDPLGNLGQDPQCGADGGVQVENRNVLQYRAAVGDEVAVGRRDAVKPRSAVGLRDAVGHRSAVGHKNAVGHMDGVGQRADQDGPRPSPRREQVLSGKCYAHYTAVALGYFAVAMRYLAE